MDTPFSKSHVLRITSMHVKKAVDTSIRKTHMRLKDKPEQSMEIIETLDILHRMRTMMEDFEKHNKHLYKGNNE